MRVIGGRIVQAFDGEQPYKVVLDIEDGGSSEHPVSTIREGEALIRERCSPASPKRSKPCDAPLS